VSAELCHPGLEGDPGTCRRLLEDHRQCLAAQEVVLRLASPVLSLELCGEIDQCDGLLWRKVVIGQEVEPLANGRDSHHTLLEHCAHGPATDERTFDLTWTCASCGCALSLSLRTALGAFPVSLSQNARCLSRETG
jgi:hypothetical protein